MPGPTKAERGSLRRCEEGGSLPQLIREGARQRAGSGRGASEQRACSRATALGLGGVCDRCGPRGLWAVPAPDPGFQQPPRMQPYGNWGLFWQDWSRRSVGLWSLTRRDGVLTGEETWTGLHTEHAA